jgi:hypothetical protein
MPKKDEREEDDAKWENLPPGVTREEVELLDQGDPEEDEPTPEPAPDPDDDESEPEPDLAAQAGDDEDGEAKPRTRLESDALRNEVAKLREARRKEQLERQQLEATLAQMKGGAPAAAPDEEKPAPEPWEVKYNEEAQRAELPRDQIEKAIEERAREIAREEAQRAMQPSEEQVVRQQYEQVKESWVKSGDAEQRRQAYERVEAGWEYLSELVSEVVTKTGHPLNTYDDAIDILRNYGVQEKLAEAVPDLVDVHRLLDASVSRSPAKTREYMDLYISQFEGDTEAGEDDAGEDYADVGDLPPIARPKAAQRTKPLPQRPRSMASKGKASRSSQRLTPSKELDKLVDLQNERGLTREQGQRFQELMEMQERLRG